MAQIAKLSIGNRGIYLASALSGIADVDAITIFLARDSSLAPSVAVTGITIAAAVNTLVKGAIAFMFGSAEFSKNIFQVVVFIIFVGLFLVWLV